MSGKEAARPGILQALCEERISNGEAATALHLTVRQVQRLKPRYRTAGAAGLVHGGRGQPSPRQLADPVRAQITTLMATVYAGFNDVHLTEKLQEAHGLPVSGPRCGAYGRRPSCRRRADAGGAPTAGDGAGKRPSARWCRSTAARMTGCRGAGRP